MLASHISAYLGTIKTVKARSEEWIPYNDKVRDYLSNNVPLEINTLGFNKNILQPDLHRTGHSFNLSVLNISPPRLGANQPYPSTVLFQSIKKDKPIL